MEYTLRRRNNGSGGIRCFVSDRCARIRNDCSGSIKHLPRDGTGAWGLRCKKTRHREDSEAEQKKTDFRFAVVVFHIVFPKGVSHFAGMAVSRKCLQSRVL